MKRIYEHHGMTGTLTHMRWKAMKKRCHTQGDTHYADYGGRGINVCEGWSTSFVAFYRDTGEPPASDLTLDRIDNDSGYWCGHCIECIENSWPKNWRWATRSEQARNRRISKIEDRELPVGVTRVGKKFQVQYFEDGTTHYVGLFSGLDEASEAYRTRKFGGVC